MKHVMDHGYRLDSAVEKTALSNLAVAKSALSDLAVADQPLRVWVAILMVPMACLGIAYHCDLSGLHRNQMLAVVETTILAIGALVGGPQFLVGVLVFREMRNHRYLRALLLVALMAGFRACPDIVHQMPEKKKKGMLESLYSAIF